IRYPSPSAYSAWVQLMLATQAPLAAALIVPARRDRPRSAGITRSASGPRPNTSRLPPGTGITRPDGVVTCVVAGVESSAIAVLPVLLVPLVPVPLLPQSAPGRRRMACGSEFWGRRRPGTHPRVRGWTRGTVRGWLCLAGARRTALGGSPPAQEIIPCHRRLSRRHGPGARAWGFVRAQDSWGDLWGSRCLPPPAPRLSRAHAAHRWRWRSRSAGQSGPAATSPGAGAAGGPGVIERSGASRLSYQLELPEMAPQADDQHDQGHHGDLRRRRTSLQCWPGGSRYAGSTRRQRQQLSPGFS